MTSQFITAMLSNFSNRDEHLKSDRYSVLETKKKIIDQLYQSRASNDSFRKTCEAGALYRMEQEKKRALKKHDERFEAATIAMNQKIESLEKYLSVRTHELSTAKEEIAALTEKLKVSEGHLQVRLCLPQK